jgi:ABC-type glycerol-3-phosphate transport system substrate-binding protein
MATKNLPAVKEVGESVSPMLKQFADLMKNSIHPNRFQVTEDPKVQEALTKGIQSILIGEKTPLQIAAEVQKAKVKAEGK